MNYFISFLEGIITFISPCMLPMLPVYISYFAGGEYEKNTFRAFVNSLGFVLGFTLMFVIMGAFAGTVGSFLKSSQGVLNVITGAIVCFFGLSFMGIFKIKLFSGISEKYKWEAKGFFSSAVFGVVFSVGWTPCVGAFLGSALMMASRQGDLLKGVYMLLFYSLGLGIPFVISAVLIDRLKGAFGFIKRHYRIINILCGGILVVVGAMMMTGILGRYLAVVGG